MTGYSTNHHRRSIRLDGYDYTQPGAYFVTICTAQRSEQLARIEAGEARLSRYGKIVQRAWDDLPRHYPQVILDAFSIMPNHVHMIIVFDGRLGSRGGSGLSANKDLVEVNPSGIGAGNGGRGGSGLSANKDWSEINPSGIGADNRGRGGSGLSANKDLVEINPSGIGAGAEGETRPYNDRMARHGLPEVVRAFKSFSARRINQLAGAQGTPFWQRNYYERIIRDENELNAIRVYIQTNPLNWEKDQEYR